MKSYNTKEILFLSICLFNFVFGYSQTSVPETNKKIINISEKFLSKEQIPGMSISISKNDTLIFSQGFGFSDFENKIPVNPSKTKFRMASITKTMTAITIGKLSELNLINPKNSIYYYLDSLPKKKFDFSIAEIGGHLSGIRRVPSAEKYSCDNDYTKKDFYKVFKKDELLFEPSTKFEYSNYGYTLLGILIEKITGKTIIENHSKFIINTIGLKNTIPEQLEKDNETSKFYVEIKNKIENAPCLDCTFKHSQGCYLTTTEDLVVLGNAYLFPDRLLKKETLVELIKSKKLKNGKKTNYGFGFETYKDLNGNYYYGHNGGYLGSRSLLRIYPNSKIVISIMTNRDIQDIDNFATELIKHYITNIK